MEEIMKALKQIEKELDEQKTVIRDSGKNVTDQVTQNITKLMDEKILLWDEKHEKRKQIVENQEKRIHFLEKQSRQRNAVFFGIEEGERSYENLESSIINWIKVHLSIKLSYNDIQEVKRIGMKGESPRPVVVTFSTLGIKIKIFKQRGALKHTNYYIKEDYPKYVLEKRKELQEQLKMERERGNAARIKYDKLIIIKNNNKRPLPTSPENNPQIQNNANTVTNKKNKTQQSRPSIQSSSGISEGVIKPGLLNYLVNKNITSNTNNKQDQKTTNK